MTKTERNIQYRIGLYAPLLQNYVELTKFTSKKKLVEYLKTDFAKEEKSFRKFHHMTHCQVNSVLLFATYGGGMSVYRQDIKLDYDIEKCCFMQDGKKYNFKNITHLRAYEVLN